MKIKIKVPFRLFEEERGEIELEDNFEFEFGTEIEVMERAAIRFAEKAAAYLGAFKDKFQYTILGYERCPGIGISFWQIRKFENDKILQERLMELLREDAKIAKDESEKPVE